MPLFENDDGLYPRRRVGGVEFTHGDHRPKELWVVLTRFLIAGGVLGAGYGLLFSRLVRPSAAAILWPIGLGLAYLVLGYVVRPQANTNNLGLWFGRWGTLHNHPFRLSDDVNRLLLAMAVLLWPGRFIAESLVDAVLYGYRAHSR